MQVNGFILAGGRSTRLGRDKALLDWHGRTLLEHMVKLLSATADNVQVAGRGALPDRLPDRGPLSGIATALEASEADANLVVAVDLPLLTIDFLKHLKSRIERSNHPLVACLAGSHYPLCLGVRKSLLPGIHQRLSEGELSIHGLIESSDADIAPWPDQRIFQNINTDKDYRIALLSSDTDD